MDPPQGSPTAVGSRMKVFAIPELVDHINRYLQFHDELRLRLVSKALCELYRPKLCFSQSTLTFPSATDKVASDNWITQLGQLGPHIRSLHLVIVGQCQKQRTMLEAIYQHCSESVRRLTMEYWSDDARTLEDILVHLPHVQDLSIAVMASMDVTKVPEAVINTRRAIHQNSKDGDNITLLLSLKISFRVKHEGSLDWPLFKELLAYCPRLKTLDLAGISFLGFHWNYMGGFMGINNNNNNNDNDNEDDDMNMAATLEQLNLMGLQYDEQSGTTVLRPCMKTLVLSQCDLTERWLHRMDKLFPDLQTLELDACSGHWISSLTSPPAQDKSVMFARLESLTVFLEFQSSREDLTGFVRGRPHLNTLRTDVRSEKKEGILEFARFCSESIPSASSNTNAIRHKFKRLAIQTYWPTAYEPLELEQFYGAQCFRGLEYVFVQTVSHPEEDIIMLRMPSNKTNMHLDDLSLFIST
ncbi:hypothetical protein BGX34_004040 [Mortierella sp. NVP85]|nr:hypothetical protein BGX34_004040 [Mortierella sp. NVP85]